MGNRGYLSKKMSFFAKYGLDTNFLVVANYFKISRMYEFRQEKAKKWLKKCSQNVHSF